MPAPTGGHSALRRLIGVPVDEFASQYWGSRPLLTRAADLPRDFRDLFSNDAVDELVSRRGLRAPFLRVAKNGSTLPDSAFTAGGGTGAGIADQASDDKLLRLFGDGATIVLQGLHRTWEPVLDFTQDLAADLGHPVQVNAYVTPAQNTGFSDHYDVHDVFVIQIAGEKRWRIREPVHRSPLRDQPWTDHRAAVEAAAQESPLLEETLRPGDVLYLPRGYLHAATALGDVSTHLTVGVHPWTRRHVADALVARALAAASEDERVRASLALGVDLTDTGAWESDLDVVREALVRALRDLPAESLTDALDLRSRQSQRAAPVNPVATVRAASQLDGTERLSLRPHLEIRLDDDRLRSRAGDIALEPSETDRVSDLLTTGVASTADLGIDLARRLLLGGVVVLTEPVDNAVDELSHP
ncbi:MAG TPA: cupin domain-containing protein [Actinomycetes bacterium]|nr:cupin domain-containing protein [Actinomycetes bacterium]